MGSFHSPLKCALHDGIMYCMRVHPVVGVLTRRSVRLKYVKWNYLPTCGIATTGPGEPAGGPLRGIDIIKRKPHDASQVTLPPTNTHYLSSQRSINKKTKDLFEEKDSNAISLHLEENISEMTTSNLITFIYEAGKYNHPLSTLQMKTIIDAIRLKDDVFNIVDVANSLYAIQAFKESDALLLVTFLTCKIQESTEAFNSQTVGMSLYGMKNLSSKTKEVSCLLNNIYE